MSGKVDAKSPVESALSTKFAISPNALARPNRKKGRGRGKCIKKGNPQNIQTHINAIKKRDQRKAFSEKQASGVERAGAAALAEQGAESRIRQMRKDMDKSHHKVLKNKGAAAPESRSKASGGRWHWLGIASRRRQKKQRMNASAADSMMMLGFESNSAQNRLQKMKTSVHQKKEYDHSPRAQSKMFKSGSTRTRLRELGGKGATRSANDDTGLKPHNCCIVS